MFKCKCGREFTTLRGKNYHKNFCGKKKISIDGGYEYYIGKDGLPVYIHREVLEKKIGRKLEPWEISHHKDDNKRNNNPDNLEVSTNTKHGKHHYEEQSKEWKEKFKMSNPEGKGKKLRGSQHPNSKLTEINVKEIKHCLNNGETQTSLGKRFGVDRTTIRDIKNSTVWKHVNI